jgi:predicted GTPase
MPPHVPDDEPLPQLPIYHYSIPTVHNNCMELVRRFNEMIGNSDYQDDEMAYFTKMFSELMSPDHETEMVQIGLIGDAGHGKSSTINSMLGIDIADYVSL